MLTLGRLDEQIDLAQVDKNCKLMATLVAQVGLAGLDQTRGERLCDRAVEADELVYVGGGGEAHIDILHVRQRDYSQKKLALERLLISSKIKFWNV